MESINLKCDINELSDYFFEITTATEHSSKYAQLTEWKIDLTHFEFNMPKGNLTGSAVFGILPTGIMRIHKDPKRTSAIIIPLVSSEYTMSNGKNEKTFHNDIIVLDTEDYHGVIKSCKDWKFLAVDLGYSYQQLKETMTDNNFYIKRQTIHESQ
jgi:hypothetical protein